jgi:hypothetical protein
VYTSLSYDTVALPCSRGWSGINDFFQKLQNYLLHAVRVHTVPLRRGARDFFKKSTRKRRRLLAWAGARLLCLIIKTQKKKNNKNLLTLAIAIPLSHRRKRAQSTTLATKRFEIMAMKLTQ